MATVYYLELNQAKTLVARSCFMMGADADFVTNVALGLDEAFLFCAAPVSVAWNASTAAAAGDGLFGNAYSGEESQLADRVLDAHLVADDERRVREQHDPGDEVRERMHCRKRERGGGAAKDGHRSWTRRAARARR